MKKIFGEINLTWGKVVIMLIVLGIYALIISLTKFEYSTLFSDLTIWIFFGIFIIMNSKSNIDSMTKCFVFFLIGQPLVYLIGDVINNSTMFENYYIQWIIFTSASIPIGYIGYYMKKEKWWGLLILSPILILLGYQYFNSLLETLFSFPYYLVSCILCLLTLIIYPIFVLKGKINKIIGIIISSVIILVCTILCINIPNEYEAQILESSDKNVFDDTYKPYLEDNNYGNLFIKYDKNKDSYIVNAKFKKGGNTKLILKSITKDELIYDIEIRRNNFKIKRIK